MSGRKRIMVVGPRGAGKDTACRFLAEVTERGGRLRQDFPASCLPITRGRVTGPLADFVSSASDGGQG